MKKQTWIRAAIICVIAAAVLIAGIILLKSNDDSQYSEKRGNMTEGFGQLKTVEIGGVKYREKPAVTTLLICGIDVPAETDDISEATYRNAGPADFLLLLGIDHTDKKIHQLQIDRDTMAEIDILGVFGNEVGTRVWQICLSHSYGKTPQDNAKYTVRAVDRLLGGVQIDGYYMIDYTAMGTINDALGGVPVKIDFDMEHLNPEWKKGTTVTLHGDEARVFVQARMNVGAGTNEERMVRQNEYMQSAVKCMNRKIAADIGFGEALLGKLQNLSTSNMTGKRLAEELVKSHKYEILPVEHPEGEYMIGKDGFMEFHMKEGAAVEWVLEHMYSRE